MSIAVVPLIGLGLNYTPWGIRLTPVVVSLAFFTVAMSAIAYWRRMSLAADDRFFVPFREGVASLKQEIQADEKSRLDRALTVVLISIFHLAFLGTIFGMAA